MFLVSNVSKKVVAETQHIAYIRFHGLCVFSPAFFGLYVAVWEVGSVGFYTQRAMDCLLVKSQDYGIGLVLFYMQVISQEEGGAVFYSHRRYYQKSLTLTPQQNH